MAKKPAPKFKPCDGCKNPMCKTMGRCLKSAAKKKK